MAVELANAYVTLVVTAKGIGADLEKELGKPAMSAAAKAGDDAGKSMSKGFSGGIGDMVAKTGVGQKAMSTFGVSAGAMGTAVAGAALAGAGAFAKFALDGARNFSDLGEKVETFKTISGTSAEQASRWLAVADDYGVSTDEMSGAIGKLGKALGANATAFDEYGVSVAHAKDGSVDLNQTTLNVMDTYNKTVDPAKKAKLATEAFGKSYTALVPLIDEGTTNILARMKEVDGAQLFDDKKLASAKNYRLAMDDLQDTISDLQMEIGQKAIPMIIALADGMSKIAGPAMTALSWGFDQLVSSIQGTATVLTLGLLGNFTTMNDEIETVTTTVDDATAAQLLHNRYLREAAEGYGPLAESTKLATTMQEAHTQAVIDYTGPSQGLNVETYNYADAVKVAADAAAVWKQKTKDALDSIQEGLDRVESKWQEMTGVISDDKAFLTLQTTFDSVKQAGTEAFDAAASGAANAEQKGRDYQIATDDLKTSVINYGKEVLGLPPERVTKMLAQIDEGSLAAVENTLEILARNRTMNLSIIAKSGAGFDKVLPGATGKATGGPVTANTPYWVGENRQPELFVPDRSGVIMTLDQVGSARPIASDTGSGGGLHVEHLEVHNDVDADGFFRLANFHLAGV